jgi:hypothetical protein
MSEITTTEKKHVNVFKFGLYQNNEPVMERVFSADSYNPVVRYSVDIRDRLSDIISKLSKTLSRKNLSYEGQGYNNVTWYRKRQKFDTDARPMPNKLAQPQSVRFKKGNIEFYGVPFRIGLYINNHPIVERDFGVSDYNPSARFSKELLDLVNGIVGDIQNHLYKVDINHMWDDWYIINTYGLNIGQIRELSKEKRQNLLRNLKNYDFIKRVRLEYKVASMNEVEEDVEPLNA